MWQPQILRAKSLTSWSTIRLYKNYSSISWTTSQRLIIIIRSQLQPPIHSLFSCFKFSFNCKVKTTRRTSLHLCCCVALHNKWACIVQPPPILSIKEDLKRSRGIGRDGRIWIPEFVRHPPWINYAKNVHLITARKTINVSPQTRSWSISREMITWYFVLSTSTGQGIPEDYFNQIVSRYQLTSSFTSPPIVCSVPRSQKVIFIRISKQN